MTKKQQNKQLLIEAKAAYADINDNYSIGEHCLDFLILAKMPIECFFPKFPQKVDISKIPVEHLPVFIEEIDRLDRLFETVQKEHGDDEMVRSILVFSAKAKEEVTQNICYACNDWVKQWEIYHTNWVKGFRKEEEE